MRSVYTAIALATLLWPSPGLAQSVSVVAVLNGGEVTPNPPLTGAVGAAAFEVDLTGGVATFDIAVFNLPSAIRSAHIHLGGPGVVGPMLFDLRPVPGQTGDFVIHGTLDGTNITARPDLGIRDAQDALQSMIGLTLYLDIHTEARPDGEIRGMLIPVSATDTATAAAVYRTLRPAWR